MTQYLEPEPHRPRGAVRRRPPLLTCLLSLWAGLAIAAGSALVIRIMATQLPLWLAAPLGSLAGFVVVSAFIVIVGRSTGRILVAVALVLIGVTLLWSIPSRLKLGRNHSHTYARFLGRH